MGGQGVLGVYWGLAGYIGAQGQKVYRWHKGVFGDPRGCCGFWDH